MRARWHRTAVVAFALGLFGDHAAAQEPTSLVARVDEVQRLTRAGKLSEAEVQIGQLEVPDAVRARLTGLVELERRDFEAAARQFERAQRAEKQAHGEADPQLALYLAHTYVQLGRFKDAVRAAQASQSLSATLVGQPLVLAHALRGAGRDAEAFDVLRAAVKQFPGEVAPRLELVALTSALSLRELAREHAEQLLRFDLDRDTVLAMVHALHRDPLAMPTLERAVARYRDDAEVRAHLAHGYAAQQNWYAAALLFEQAAMLGGDYAFEAADQFRLAGATRRALAMNGRVQQSTQRAQQRLSILFAAGEMARVVALEPELHRGKVDDDATTYRLAYAHFALHQNEKSARLARKLIGTGYESQARTLLASMGKSTEPEGP